MSNISNFGTQFSVGGIPLLPNPSTAQILASNIGTGDIDLYTVPAGKRALVECQVWNSTASSISYFAEVKIGATYYPLSAKQTLANTAGENANAFPLYPIVLEAGQKVAINTTGTGLNVTGTVYLFDNTGNLKSAVITTFIAGDNTVYTCPAGKTSYLVHGPASLGSTAATVPFIFGMNGAGATIAYKWNVVASGGSPGTSNQITISISSAATAGNPITFGRNVSAAFTPGDFISVNSGANTAGQIAWVNVVEQP
jgi:hypothetical protein